MTPPPLRVALDGDASTPLDRLLGEAAAAGCEGAVPAAAAAADPAALAEAFAGRGLALAALAHPARLRARTAAEEAAAAAPALARLAAAGARVCLLTEAAGAIDADATTPLRDRPRLERADWPAFARRAGELARRLADAGAVAAWRPAAGGVVAGRDDLLRLLDGAGEALGVAFDPGALALAGAEPAALAADLGERLRFLFATAAAPDAAAKADRDRLSLPAARAAGLLLDPGDPDSGLGAVLEAAARAGYAGWIAVAPPSAPAPRDPEAPRPTVAGTVEALRGLAAAAGFRAPGPSPTEARR